MPSFEKSINLGWSCSVRKKWKCKLHTQQWSHPAVLMNHKKQL